MHVLSACLFELGHWFCPALWNRIYSISSPGPQVFRFRLELYHQFSWVSNLQTIDHGAFSASMLHELISHNESPFTYVCYDSYIYEYSYRIYMHLYFTYIHIMGN